MADLEKYSLIHDISSLLKHYARENHSGRYRNPDVDITRSPLNYNLAPDRGDYQQTLSYLKEKLELISPKQRKDGVKMCNWIVTLPKTLDPSKEKIFFSETYNFLAERYGRKSGMGEDVVLSSFVQKDESQPHMHFCFLPVIEREGKQAFCAKELINKKELQHFHQDLEQYLVNRGICRKGDIYSGITKAQGGNRSIRQLKHERDIERTQEISRWDRSDRSDLSEISRWD